MREIILIFVILIIVIFTFQTFSPAQKTQKPQETGYITGEVLKTDTKINVTNTITIKDANSNTQTIIVDKDTKIYKDQTVISFGDIKKEHTIMVSFIMKGNSRIATSIDVTESASSVKQ